MSEKNIKTCSRTDWERLDAMADEDIDYRDIPPLSDAFFQHAKLYVPKSLSIRLDQDIYTWFARQGNDYPTLINSVLREYVKRQQRKATKPKRLTATSRS